MPITWQSAEERTILCFHLLYLSASILHTPLGQLSLLMSMCVVGRNDHSDDIFVRRYISSRTCDPAPPVVICLRLGDEKTYKSVLGRVNTLVFTLPNFVSRYATRYPGIIEHDLDTLRVPTFRSHRVRIFQIDTHVRYTVHSTPSNVLHGFKVWFHFCFSVLYSDCPNFHCFSYPCLFLSSLRLERSPVERTLGPAHPPQSPHKHGWIYRGLVNERPSTNRSTNQISPAMVSATENDE